MGSSKRRRKIRKTKKTVLARDKLGHFTKVNGRLLQRLVLFQNGKYVGEEKKYKRHTKKEIILFELKRFRKKKIQIVEKKVSLSEVKENAYDYQKYREEIFERTGQDIWGYNFKLFDLKKKVILDNIATDDDSFNGFSVCYLADSDDLRFITITFEHHRYKTFAQIYQEIDLEQILRAIKRYANKKQGYSMPLEILSIYLRDDIDRDGKIQINGKVSIE